MRGRRPTPGGVRRCVGALVAAAIAVVAAGIPLLDPGGGASRSPTSDADRAMAAERPSTASADQFSGWWRVPTPGPAPVARMDGMMEYDPEEGAVILFGGCPTIASDGRCPDPLNDTWSYSAGSWTELHPARSPPARSAGMLAYDAASLSLVLFGGWGSGRVLNDTWTFFDNQWTPIHPHPAPPPLFFAAMAPDPDIDEVVLFGGLAPNATYASSATWLYTTGNWTDLVVAPHPAGWVAPYAATIPSEEGLLLFGGVTSLQYPQYDSQTWILSDETWVNETALAGNAPPGPRAWALGGSDQPLYETVMYGGLVGSTSLDDLWGFDSAGSWVSVTGIQTPPGAFDQTQAAYDARDQYILEFGRENLGSLGGPPMIEGLTNETWALLTGVGVSVALSSAQIQPGGNLSASGLAYGGLPPYAFSWSFGDGTGSTLPSPVHEYRTAGVYNVTLVITDTAGQRAVVVRTVQVGDPGTVAPPPVAPSSPPPSWTLWWPAIGAGGLIVTAVSVAVYLRVRRKVDAPNPKWGQPPGTRR